MTSNIPRNQVLKLYKSMIAESKKIPAYNFRNYAVRRVRDGFKQNKQLTEKSLIEEQLDLARKSLELIKRQAVIAQMYSTDKLVIEHRNK